MWLLRSSDVDLPELDDETTAQARALAGESAVSLTASRAAILVAAAAEIEEYVGRLFYRGLAGSARACSTVIELDAAGDAPAVAQFPMTDPVNVTNIVRWADEAAAFQSSEFIVRPVGMVRLPTAGVYRIMASATPSSNYPASVMEGVARLFSYRENVRPRMVSGDLADGTFPTQAGGVLKSGAAEILRHVPRMRV